jgi:hypothetical protein
MNGGWSNLGGLTEPSLMSTTAHLGKMKMTEHPTRHPHQSSLHYCSVNNASWPIILLHPYSRVTDLVLIIILCFTTVKLVRSL